MTKRRMSHNFSIQADPPPTSTALIHLVTLGECVECSTDTNVAENDVGHRSCIGRSKKEIADRRDPRSDRIGLHVSNYA